MPNCDSRLEDAELENNIDRLPRKLGNELVRPKKITKRFSGRLSPPLNLIVIFLAKSKIVNNFLANFDLMRI